MVVTAGRAKTPCFRRVRGRARGHAVPGKARAGPQVSLLTPGPGPSPRTTLPLRKRFSVKSGTCQSAEPLRADAACLADRPPRGALRQASPNAAHNPDSGPTAAGGERGHGPEARLQKKGGFRGNGSIC